MNLFALAAKITLDVAGFNDGIEKAEKVFNGFTSVIQKGASAISSIGSGLSTGISTAVSVMQTSLSGITTAIEKIDSVGTSAVKVLGSVATAAKDVGLALGKESIDSYADYEQLVGGVDTLFKDASETVQAYADSAYEDVGMSANDYMEMVTAFAASLMQSLDNDTDAAAEKANLAIQDMMDNANKMGTATESVQNAYKGFAKNNYTMLDNLKLGYGGTKEEMERLLADATELSGIEYDMSSLADVIDAIHVIQDEMDITGTTALEASTTISGSLSSVKASVSNLKTAFASDDLSLDDKIGQTLESLETYATNVLPRIESIFNNSIYVLNQYSGTVGSLLGNMAKEIKEKAPGLIDEAFAAINTAISNLSKDSKDIKEAAEAIIKKLAEGITGTISSIEPAADDIIGGIASGLITYKETTLNLGLTIIQDVASGISNNLSEIESSAKSVLDEFVKKVTDEKKLKDLAEDAVDIVVAVANGISYAVDKLVPAAMDVILAFGEALVEKDAVEELVRAAGNVVTSFIGGFTEERLDKVFEVGGEILNQILSAIAGDEENEGVANKIAKAALQLITALGKKIVENAPEMGEKAEELLNQFVGWFAVSGNLEMLDDAAAAIVTGVFSLAGAAIDAIEGFVTSILNKIYDYFTGHTAEEVIGDAAEYLAGIFRSKFVESLVFGAFDLIFRSDSSKEFFGSIISPFTTLADWVNDDTYYTDLRREYGYSNASENNHQMESNILKSSVAELNEQFGIGTIEIDDELQKKIDEVDAAKKQLEEDAAAEKAAALEKAAASGTAFPTSGTNVTINQTINATAQSPSELMKEALYRAEQAVIFGE